MQFLSTNRSEPFCVLLTERMPGPGMQLLRARSDLKLRVLEPQDWHGLISVLPDADALIIVGEQPASTAAMLERATRLRCVARMGAGTDNIDVQALTHLGIPVLTTGATNAPVVAEHALHLLLALAKHGPLLDRAVKAGQWPRSFGAVELAGQTCLIVGLGRIGSEIAKRAAAFDLKLIGVDPVVGAEVASALGVALMQSLDEALAIADVVILACPLTEATRGLMSEHRLALMKRGSLIINVSRGPVVDEDALDRALAAGQLAGAGLDVLAYEPPRPHHPLLKRDNVVLTPHTGSQVASVYDRMSVVCAEAVINALQGRFSLELVADPAALSSVPNDAAKPRQC